MIANATSPDDKAGEIIRQFGLLQGDRGVWEAHWQEIAERIWPNYSYSFNPFWFVTPGGKRMDKVFDSTASLALNRFGAILDSLLTPRNQKWHRIKSSNPDLNKRRDVQLWFENVNNILFHFRYLPEANFSAQNQNNFKGLGSFGTSSMFTDELDGGFGIRYKSMSLGECYFSENHQGIVDKVFRYFGLTARQALQKWGEKVPKMIMDQADTNPNYVWKFLHLVEPRTDDYDPNRRDAKGKKWASYYVSIEGQSILSEGGYRQFPYQVSRYEQAPNEIYGRSPAMDLLPSIKTLNEEKKTMLKAGHRAVDPVLLAYDDGVVDSFSAKPGAVNAGGVSADGRPLVHALPTGNLQISKEMMDDERSLINDGFLVSLFQILTETPQMTATEVLERTKEKGILLAPTIGRQQSEYLGPLIDREIDILSMQGLLPPMPLALKQAGAHYKMEYDSPLSRAQRAEEAVGLMRTIESALQVVQVTQNPEALDFFDWDTIMPEMADINAVPFRWLKSVQAVQALRAQRQQQQAVQNAIQAAPGAAAMVKAGAVASAQGQS